MNRHPLDAVSLVFGAIFSGIGALFLAGYQTWEMVSRFWPAGVILLGLAMFFSARRHDEAAPTPPVREAPEATAPIEPSE